MARMPDEKPHAAENAELETAARTKEPALPEGAIVLVSLGLLTMVGLGLFQFLAR